MTEEYNINLTKNLTFSPEDSTKAKHFFMIYVRTMQLINSRYKGNDEVTPVHISQKLIENEYFIYPAHNRKECLAELVASGELKIHKGSFFTYEALTEGDIDLSLIKPKIDNWNSPLIDSIRNDLKHVTLTKNAPSTTYFDTFLKNKEEYLNLFFTVDDFARRIHTPVTNFHREYRPNILFYGKEIASFDVATMQPLLLGKILKNAIGDNEYSRWIDEGKDIYVMLQKKADLNSRDDAKKRFFEIMFSPPSEDLAEMFGNSDWIDWINNFKKQIIIGNPHNKIKRHSNLAWLLQTTEVKIMYKVWLELYEAEIPFLTIHDEVIVKEEDGAQAESLFSQVLNVSFDYYKLNSKIDAPEEVEPEEEPEEEYEFRLNDVQVEIIMEEILKGMIEYKVGVITKGIKEKKEKIKLVKSYEQDITRNIIDHLFIQENLEKRIRLFYSRSYKSNITEENLTKIVEFYHTKKIIVTVKSFGRYFFYVKPLL